MKKGFIYLMAGTLLFASCDTYTGQGAATGATFGSILGSAIGDISGGWRGSDIGTIVGMAGGAAVGAVIGQQADQAREQKIHDRYEQIQQNKARGYNPYDQNSDRTRSNSNSTDEAYNGGSGNNGTYNNDGSDNNGSETPYNDAVVDTTNSGDDRITMSVGKSDDYTASAPTTVVPDSQSHFELIPTGVSYTPNIQITNARFVDNNQDGFLGRGETAKVTFEIYNRGSQTLYNVIPSVIETSHNKHISITPSIIVESLAPGRGITYTAFVKADSKLNDGTAKFALAVLQGKKSISKVTEFTIRTKK